MPNKKQKKIKPYLIYSAWKRERVSSLIQLGEIKSRKDKRAITARTKRDIYDTEKKNYYVSKLRPKLAQKFTEISKHSKRIQNIAKKNIKTKLKQLDFTPEVIETILSQRNIIQIINTAQSSIESKKVYKKLIQHRKNKTYDYSTKRWYKDIDYSRKISMEKYWVKVKSLSEALSMEINEVRNLLKIGGDDMFEGLTESVFIYAPDFASPEELRDYWGKIRDWSKELNMPIPKVRSIYKHFGENYFIKRGK
jgi:hypothetical protein